ncbi:MAG: haloacid dehalogenase type II [Bacteroidetes bacterium]|nr:haloacid dehalogenase type II [Bacteroidota bacterium]
MKKPQVLLFDVNETLLDLSSMKTEINDSLGHEFAFNQWFAMLLHYSLVSNETNLYQPFGAVGKATLRMAAQALGCEVSDEEIGRLVKLILQRPPHPEIFENLTRLQNKGYRLATLTNSAEDALKKQMEFAELTPFFEALLSVDAVGKYKPHPDTYRMAARHLNVPMEEILMVAAHGWDIAGAGSAGMQTAFLARPGQALYPLAPQPHYLASDLAQLTDQLIHL